MKSVSIYTVVFLGEAQEGDSVVKDRVKCKGQEIPQNLTNSMLVTWDDSNTWWMYRKEAYYWKHMLPDPRSRVQLCF